MLLNVFALQVDDYLTDCYVAVCKLRASHIMIIMIMIIIILDTFICSSDFRHCERWKDSRGTNKDKSR